MHGLATRTTRSSSQTRMWQRGGNGASDRASPRQSLTSVAIPRDTAAGFFLSALFKAPRGHKVSRAQGLAGTRSRGHKMSRGHEMWLPRRDDPRRVLFVQARGAWTVAEKADI